MGVKAYLASTTVSLFFAGAVHAGDLLHNDGSLKDVPFVEASWNWTGFYGGAVTGYGSGSSRNQVTANNNDAHGWASNDPDGWVLGGTVGYNYQFSPNWVAGVEADLSFADISGEEDKYIYDGHRWHGGWDGLFTLRGRLGYALGPNLFYVTGGYAARHSNELIAGNNITESDSGSGWRSGWIVGGGIEHVFTPRITGKIEYLHADFETLSGQTGFPGQMADQYYKLESDLDLVRVGINYKFY